MSAGVLVALRDAFSERPNTAADIRVVACNEGGEQMFGNARHEANVEKIDTEVERRTA